MEMPPTPHPKWYHKVGFVLAMLFLILGPLALPLLWQSHQFSKLMKWLLSLATLFYTVWLLRTTGSLAGQLLDQMSRL